MRYVTATIGAIFIFVAVIAIGFVVNAFLPPALQQVVTVPLGVFFLRANPSVLIGLGLALPLAVHSFRSTLKREATKADLDVGGPTDPRD
jgi:hypothetical protein